ncbi:similar to Saccharomyces cerevisiae YFL030W AGX1 Alanine:glyoxylate aminotransferase (AGT) [Maudiozyma barnettii]|uniref:alanine--glyoxylate transaminase n=1 Tax=Maudiozyma barnettii TaxID=61262 RepID=A0A8H2ZHU8_9SACH|nr:alanine--glyoxylate transaminase [Kazachstania barnettii]CAB4252474.1 similar to Saccharomyces cerevisiae YFL030W AGX1 Alanine:glyoxylate aminotransferase (AGT) [Kazachstania barnettii]CAD1779209.1 similar to Saccharomyces cerevisiae YFL030W AGX1 Alanine:glyoxylate aminotransferase (AGT) [Kazachstania barnettii]
MLLGKLLLRNKNPSHTTTFTRRQITTMSLSKDHTKLLIPGPITLSTEVIAALGQQSVSHTCPSFTTSFKDTLKMLRQVYVAHEARGMPLVISGSGTLGFDLVGSNLINPAKDQILLLSTGFFSDEFHEAISTYYVDNSNQVTRLSAANAGDSIPLNKIESELQNKKYNLIVMTQVDTSTGVLLDIEKIAALVHKVSPDTLIAVDTVCSLGCENIQFDKWGLDICISASQKAIGAPPGLSLGMVSDRAILKSETDITSRNGSYYTSFKKWLPILEAFESGKPAYFATPPVQLIDSLRVALEQILQFSYKGQTGIEARVNKHKDTSDNFKTCITDKLGQQLVSKTLDNSAHGLTAIYVTNPPSVISYMQQHGYTITGGIHKDIKSKYVRVGHMGVSACDDSLNDISGCLSTLSDALQQQQQQQQQ